ncbi:hypothetical protein BB561_001159 [Smittium simulii]|uniref:Uncharacterized protein n=1 Tax=Smittium simulii TaxID=133385 RepID=A0A2T9YVY0_9FUNG|nr:hypothetical protein BB561_001159 [Smittium simulii]
MEQDLQEKIFVAISSLTEKKEKKKIIYECSRFLGIKYTPSPLSKAVTPAVCKSNTVLYGIQMALANMTRPINNYVHNKLKASATRIKGNDDLEFAHLMQAKLFDVASNINQARIENLHNSMRLPVRVPQLFEPTLKSLVKNKQLDAVIDSKRSQQKTETEIEAPFVCTSRMPYVNAPAVAHITQNATQTSTITAINFQTKTTLYVLSRLGQTHIQQKPKATMKKNFICSRGISAKQLIPKNLNIFLEEGRSSTLKKKINTGISYGLLLTLHSHCYKQKINNKASDAITKEVAALLAKKAIKQIKSTTPGFYNQHCIIPKKTRDLWPVLDLRKLKNFVKDKNFKIESLIYICRIIEKKIT